MVKSEKKNKKRLTGKTVLVCLLAIFVVYMGVNFIINSGGSTITYIAREGTQAESFVVDGFIIKSQSIIKAPQDGYIECVADESERVSVGDTVAYIYENEIDNETKNRIKEIDEKVKKLEEDNRSMAASENDGIRLEKDVMSEVMLFASYVRDNDMESINGAKESLYDIVEEKKKISGNYSDNEETVKQLEKEKRELESKNNVEKTEIKSTVAGSFTARTDGLEEKLSEARLDDISQSYLESIQAVEKAEKESSKVAKGETVGKVVDTYTWYFAAITDKEITDTLKAGDSIRLKFLDSSDNIIDGTVSKITDETNGKAVLVIKSAGYVDNLYSMSSARVEVIKRTYEGIKIPSKAVRVKDGKKGVYIVSGNKVKFRNAEVYYIDDEWAIVSREEKNGIELYDDIVVSGSNIYEGKVVR